MFAQVRTMSLLRPAAAACIITPPPPHTPLPHPQRRISALLEGEAYACLEATVGQEALRRTVLDTPPDSILIKLRIPLEKGTDPDDTYCETPYEIGYAFLKYLQAAVGDVARFDAFLKAYVARFARQSLVGEDMLAFFLASFPELAALEHREGASVPVCDGGQGRCWWRSRGRRGALRLPCPTFDSTPRPAGLSFGRWLNEGGMPPVAPDLSAAATLTGPTTALAELWC